MNSVLLIVYITLIAISSMNIGLNLIFFILERLDGISSPTDRKE